MLVSMMGPDEHVECKQTAMMGPDESTPWYCVISSKAMTKAGTRNIPSARCRLIPPHHFRLFTFCLRVPPHH